MKRADAAEGDVGNLDRPFAAAGIISRHKTAEGELQKLVAEAGTI